MSAVEQAWRFVLGGEECPADPSYFFTWGTVAIHELLYFAGSLLVWIVGKSGCFERWRIQQHPPRPSDAPAPLKVCLVIAFNHIVVQGIGLGANWPLFRDYARLQTCVSTLPPLLTLLVQLAIFILVEDAVFFWSHRLLHVKGLYRHIHKLHHEFHRPTGFASEYAHPLEFIVTNVPGFVGGPLLVGYLSSSGLHLVTFWTWAILRLVEALDGHCGFHFPFSPFNVFPFRPTAAVHDFHHSHNTGSFGSFLRFWDWVCGTDVPYKEYVKKQQ